MNRRAYVIGAAAAIVGRWLDLGTAAAQDWIVDEIHHAAWRHGVDGGWLEATARCESGLDPYAVNPRTGDSGLFQFNPQTWEMWGGGDIWSVHDQCEKAAWAFGQGLAHHWCCSGEWRGGPCQ